MKHLIFLLFVFLFLTDNTAEGQIYNPYMYQQQMYQQQMANQQAYQMGQEMRRRDDYERAHNPSYLWPAAIENLGLGNYEKAYEKLETLASEHDYGQAYYYLGLMNEMGIGTSQSRSYARKCYQRGYELGNINCKNEIRRYDSGAYYGSEARENFMSYWTQVVLSTNQMVNQTFGNWQISSPSNSNRSSSSRNGGRCSVCGGTGVNPRYMGEGGTGSLSTWAGYYNQSGIRCPHCGHTTGHMHDRCAHCNVPGS